MRQISFASSMAFIPSTSIILNTLLTWSWMMRRMTANAQHDPYFMENRNVIVHLFEWKFNDVANECENFLSPKGYGGVQLSPVNECAIVKEGKGSNINRPWWERYQPISYKIQSRSGNELEFLEMSKKCNNAGIRLYVDVVLNHMAAPPNYKNPFINTPTTTTTTTVSSNSTSDTDNDPISDVNNIELIGIAGSVASANKRNYPGVPYTFKNFHKPCTIQDYTDGHEIRNCMLWTLPDLDHSQEYVKSKIVQFLNRLIDLGAAGFRIDAAKHIWPNDLENILNKVKNLNPEFGFPEGTRPFIYQEVIDLEEEAISKTEYFHLGVVTEFLYLAEIGAIFKGETPMASVKNWNPKMKFLPSNDALVFVDNHKSQRGHGVGNEMILTYKNPKKYIMAIAFMLSYPYGIPRLMSSYEFENSDQGPPTLSPDDDEITSPRNNDTIDDGQCNKGWVCEHRWNSILNMVEFRNNVKDTMDPVMNWIENGPNQIAFCRGKKGFIAFNNDAENDFNLVNVNACLDPGTYCDIISGKVEMSLNKCTGQEIIVDENGIIVNLTIPVNSEFGVVAIHQGSKLK